MSAVKTPSIPAVERTLRILEALSGSRNGLTLSQLLEIVGIPKSSLHCLLLTLERNEYLHRSPQSGRYLFGHKLMTLAYGAMQNLQIREAAAPYLIDLMQSTRLTVHMAVVENQQAVLVSKYNPPGSMRLATWRGKSMELHCTGLGKAIGAFLPEQEIEQIFLQRGFPRNNENTFTSLRRVREDYTKIRQRMYAIDDEEDELGYRCLGAPVFGANGNVSGAISLAGTTLQINADNLPRLAERLKSCAGIISSAMGHARSENGYLGA